MSTIVLAHANASAPEIGTSTQSVPSRASKWGSRIMIGIAVPFLLLDAVMKVAQIQPVVDGMSQLGYPVGTAFGLGLALLASTILYAIPRTSLLGAVLLTGYLGGAISTHVRVGNPLFSHVLFPVYIALLIWGALYLRDYRLRALIPFRGTHA